ncbi:hypothetical protein K1719_004872 [Acacia pycnantha]|nr:hypothetical protein K1719_004872 [Acacia pycnantha]
MAHNSHVPKFGNWDRDDEYTAYFETARREKDLNSLTMVNPNDPEQNPEASNFVTGSTVSAGGSDGSISRNSNNSLGRSTRRRSLSHQRGRDSYGSFKQESVSSRSNYPDHAVLQRRENKRSVSRGGNVGPAGSFSSSSYHRRGSGSHASRDSEDQEAATIPKFGDWDEKDPKSGDSFTVIFRKLKQERQTESDQLPHAPSRLAHFSNAPNQHQRPTAKTRGPKYCCFFN